MCEPLESLPAGLQDKVNSGGDVLMRDLNVRPIISSVLCVETGMRNLFMRNNDETDVYPSVALRFLN